MQDVKGSTCNTVQEFECYFFCNLFLRNCDERRLDIHEVFKVFVFSDCSNNGGGEKLAIDKISIKRRQFSNFVGLLVGREILLGLSPVLIGVCEEGVFADHTHENGGYVECPASIVDDHSLDMVDGERDDGDTSDECATISALQFDNSIDNKVDKKGHPDIETVDIELKGCAEDE